MSKLVGYIGGVVLCLAPGQGLLGCFSPTIQEGIECSETRQCPSGQTCTNSGVCQGGTSSGTPDARVSLIDARTVVSPDADPCLPGSRTYEYTGQIITYEVPDCIDSITMEAFGAQGGGSIDDAQVGGKGARMRGVFTILDGEVLSILVGGRGKDAIAGDPNFTYEQAGGTGGGASFVVSDGIALLIAAGGGGATDRQIPRPGGDGQVGPAGQDGGEGGAGGVNGGGGGAFDNPGFHSGAGGGGFTGDGLGSTNGGSQFGTPNAPGKSFSNGSVGGIGGTQGRSGGFGGGGAAGFTGGGGGGYSGGGAGGAETAAAGRGGGGGGSLNIGTSPDNSPGANTGNGKIIFTW